MAHRRFIWAVGSSLLVLLLCGTALAAGPHAYITRSWSNQVDVIDTASATVVKTIQVGEEPVGVAVTPTRAYVANAFDDTVSVINTADHTVVATIPVGRRPLGIAADPAGQRVYVANQNDNSVTVIDTTTNLVLDTVGVGIRPVGVVVNPAGTRVFVTTPGSGTLDVIDTAGPSWQASIVIGSSVAGVAVSPDGTRVWVAYQGGLAMFEPETGSVTPIPLGSFPFGVAVDPQGSRVYVGHLTGSVSVVDAATATPFDDTLWVGSGAYGLTVNPTAPELWVAATDMDHVAVVDTDHLTWTKTVEVLDGPAAFGTFITAPAPDEGCADGLHAAVESALEKVEGAIRQNLDGNFSVPGATPAARLARLTRGVQQLSRGHLMGAYQNLLGPQAAGMADPEPCDESLKLAVQQALATLEGALQGIDKNFQLPGNGLVSRLHNVADALARLEHGRLQGLYGNLL